MTEFRLTVSAHEHDSEPTNVGEVRITDLSFLLTVLLENQKHGTSACLGGGCRYPMLLSGALAAPLRRIDGGLYIDVLARIIHSRRSLDEVAVSCITATGVKCPLPLLETG